MGNNWMIPRNKRKLLPVVDVLSLFTLENSGVEWGNLAAQRDFEDALERFGLKRPGSRRDGRAGGARTYEAWLSNLGLIFKETSTGLVRTTLAGEALLAGEPPVPILTNQLMKLQYPSPYSIRTNVNINRRFRIRPFRFLLRLLMDSRVFTLSNDEIAYLIVPLTEDESVASFEETVERIQVYRATGLHTLPANFGEIYRSRVGIRSDEKTLEEFRTIANTFVNYLEYTQLIVRDRNDEGSFIRVHGGARPMVNEILNDGTSIRNLDMQNPFGIENFQRGFGLAPGQNRDNRTFNVHTTSVNLYRNRRVRSEVLHLSASRPIVAIDAALINEVSTITGYTVHEVESALHGFEPNTLSQFESNYLDMAVSGTVRATEFETATTEIFEELGFNAQHVGPRPLHPDIFVESRLDFSGIIDTKAIRLYSPNNDHRNRMIRNYIPTYQEQYDNLEFFMYIADSFSPSYANKIQRIVSETDVNGSGLTAYNLLQLLNRHLNNPIGHEGLRDLFQKNSVISLGEINDL